MPALRWVRDPSWSRTFIAALVTWLLLGLTWAVASPAFSVPDEPAHVIRAASVAGGQLLGEAREVELPGPPLVRKVEHEVTVPMAFTLSDVNPVCFIFGRGPADCADPLPLVAGGGRTVTTAGAYQPAFYGAVGWPLQVITDPNDALLVARAVHVLLGALLLAASAAACWDVGGRVHLAVLALGVTPVVPYLLGSVNPNGLEIAAATALWAGSLGLVLRAQMRYAALTAIALGVLAWTRPLSPLIAIGILVTVVAAASSPTRMRALRRRGVVLWLAGGVTALLGAIAWVVAVGALDAFVGTPDPQMVGATAMVASVVRSGSRLIEMVGHLGWLDTPLPRWLTIGWGLTVVAAVGVALHVGWWRDRIVLVGLVGAVLAVPVLAEVARAAELGLFWQGRYTLPVAVGVPVLAGWVISRTDRLRYPVNRAVAGGIAAVVAVGHGTAQLEAMARYSTGPGTSAVAWIWRPGWVAAVPDVALVALVVAGAVAVVLLLLMSERPLAERTGQVAGDVPAEGSVPAT